MEDSLTSSPCLIAAGLHALSSKIDGLAKSERCPGSHFVISYVLLMGNEGGQNVDNHPHASLDVPQH